MSIEALSASVADTIDKTDGYVFRVEGPGLRRSGVAIDGYIVTAAHGIDSDDSLKVTAPGKNEAPLQPAGVDRRLDLAFFKAEGDYPSLPAHEENGLKVGNFVFALGRPGRSLRAAFGMISTYAPEFRGPTGVKLKPYIEVDGNLPRGFSGGPLISHSGNLIGINTSVPRGSGMTVPVGNIRRSIEGIGKEGNQRIGYFGINTAGAKLAGGETGLVVTGVDPDSPAAVSGVATGDVILVMDGEPMVSQAALYHVLLDGSRSVTLEISRGSARKEIHATLSERLGE
jgi:serine protease DegQ